MGKRGPAPKPSRLRVLQGNPGKRPLNENEPKPKLVAPKRPPWITGEARKEWERVAPELEKLGLLTVVDGASLAAYCVAYGRMVTAERAIKEHFKKHKKLTYTYVNKAGAENEITIPEIAIARDAAKQVKDFAAQFGLTPSARSRFTVPSDADRKDDFEEFVSNGRPSVR